MTTARQDAWTQDEDLLLAEVVLRHIREGSTQLTAFEEVGRRLSRTSAACGFRWNSYVRKQYKSAIEIAKKQRKGGKVDDSTPTPVNEQNSESEELEDQQSESEKEEQKADLELDTKKKLDSKVNDMNLKSIIHYLADLEAANKNQNGLSKEIDELKAENEQLVNENNALKAEIEELREQFNLIEEDYKAVIKVMETARKMIVLQEDESNRKFSFQMDKNGNLERVKK